MKPAKNQFPSKMIIIQAVVIALVPFYSEALDNYNNQIINTKYSLYYHLDKYGFDTLDKKEALEYLLNQIPTVKKLSLQGRFPIRSNFNDLVNDILEFVSLTQQEFVRRSGGKERWEVDNPLWLNNNITETCSNLKTLGFVDEIFPTKNHGNDLDAVVIFGATGPTIEKRINYVVDLKNNQHIQLANLILLSGERKITIGVDGTKEELIEIAKKHNIDLAKLTEVTLFKEIYQNSSLANYTPEPIIFDVLKKNLSRPNTQTTTSELFDWLETHPELKNLLFVSNQPHVQYQKAIVQEILKSHKDIEKEITFEVIGPGCICENNAQIALSGLGAFVFAKTPEVLLQFSEKINNMDLIDKLRSSYEKAQPLVYDRLSSELIESEKLNYSGNSTKEIEVDY